MPSGSTCGTPFDVLLFVEATDTRTWNEPLEYYSRTTGFLLLLLYKFLVLAPVLAAAATAWRGRR